MTYNVFGGTLNVAQPINQRLVILQGLTEPAMFAAVDVKLTTPTTWYVVICPVLFGGC